MVSEDSFLEEFLFVVFFLFFFPWLRNKHLEEIDASKRMENKWLIDWDCKRSGRTVGGWLGRQSFAGGRGYTPLKQKRLVKEEASKYWIIYTDTNVVFLFLFSGVWLLLPPLLMSILIVEFFKFSFIRDPEGWWFEPRSEPLLLLCDLPPPIPPMWCDELLFWDTGFLSQEPLSPPRSDWVAAREGWWLPP